MVSYLKHYFSVNTAEKVVVKQSEWKITVAQYEQDATCLVFDMPRYIDGHDMLACNAKEVHYTTRGGGLGVYEIVDAALKKGSDKIITFSWYLSSIATENVGPLSFVVRFAEIENSNPTNILFDWYTLSNDKDIEIIAGMNNGKPVIEPHVDILNQWRMALLADTIVSLKQIKTSTESLGENIWEATFKDGRKEQLVIRNGAEGHTPEAGVDYYTPEEIEEIKLELQEYVDEVVSQTEFEGGAGEKTGNNNEIFNVYEDIIIGNQVLAKNQAISIASHAEGGGTIAGAKAFVIQSSRNIEIDENTTIAVYTLDSVNGIEIGDEFSIKYSSNYDFCGVVYKIGPDTELGLSENEIASEGTIINASGGDSIMWFPYKPTIGTIVMGCGQHAEGGDTKAVGTHSHAEGYGTISGGMYSHAEGKETITGYAAHAEGTSTQALGLYSHAQGQGTKSSGQASFSGGLYTEAIGKGTTALGLYTTATRSYSTAMGQYNEDREDALLMVGDGVAGSRHNAFVVLEDGTAEVRKQGTNPNSLVKWDTFEPVVDEVKLMRVEEEVKGNNWVVVNAPSSGTHRIVSSVGGTIQKYGINLMKLTYSATKNGLTFTVNADGSLTINGTATKKFDGRIMYEYYKLPTGRYSLSVTGLDKTAHVGSLINIRVGDFGSNSRIVIELTDAVNVSSTTVDVGSPIEKGSISMTIPNGETFNNETLYIQFQAGEVTDYQPAIAAVQIKTEENIPTTINVVANEEYTLVSEVEGNTISCSYQVNTKEYVDKKIGSIEAALDEILKMQEGLIIPNGDEVSY